MDHVDNLLAIKSPADYAIRVPRVEAIGFAASRDVFIPCDRANPSRKTRVKSVLSTNRMNLNELIRR